MVTKLFMLVVNENEKSSTLRKRVNAGGCAVQGRIRGKC